MGTIAGDDPIVETKQDVVPAVGFGRLLDLKTKGAARIEAGRVALEPILVVGSAIVVDQDHAVCGSIGNEPAGNGHYVCLGIVSSLVVGQPDTQVRGSSKYRMLPEHRCGGLVQVGLVAIWKAALLADRINRPHEGVSQPESGTRPQMRQTEGVSQLMDGCLEEVLKVEALRPTLIGSNFAGNRIVVD